MLAADVVSAPWHNALNPADVNGDHRVSPFDAILVINDILSNGVRTLDPQSVSPLTGSSDSEPRYYHDASGDNRISPFDLLIVVNELIDSELIELRTFTTDLNDVPISTIEVGMDYKLHTEVRDIRDPVAQFPGVFAAAADVRFDAALSSVDTGQDLVFDDFFNELEPSVLNPGQVSAAGFSGSLTPPGNAPQPLWSVVLTATAAGTQTFTPMPTDNPDHEYLLLGDTGGIMLDPTDVHFVGSTLEITGPPVFSIDSVQQNEDAGPLEFVVSVGGTVEENVTVEFATSDGVGGSPAIAGDDYTATSGTLTFEPGGATTMTIQVPITADTDVESDEEFNVTLSNPSPGAEIDTAVGVGTIVNDDFLATFVIDNVTRNEDDPGTFDFTVSISGAYIEPVTVEFATSDGDGANPATVADNDYQAASGTLTFLPDGATTMVISVTVEDDIKIEEDEQFKVVLSNPSDNAVIGVAEGVGTIVNDDEFGFLSIGSVTVNNVTVGNTIAEFTVTLSEPSADEVTVEYATSDIGDAVAGVDYTATSDTLTFAPGTQIGTIPVEIRGDDMADDVDRFLVTLSNPVNANIDVGQATGTIIPAVGEPSIGISDVSAQEGDVGTTDFVFTVTLSGPSGQPVEVAFATADGTATAGNNDYTPTSGTITFAPLQTAQEVTVSVIGDNDPEPNETFLLNVTAVDNGGAVGAAQGTATIVDDDAAPTLSISDATATPGGGIADAVFVVTITGEVTQPVTVGFATADDSAVKNIDYLAVSGNLTFLPGGPTSQEIRVTTLGGTSPEPDKSFFVNLSSPTPAGVILGDDTGVGTIITQGISISDAFVVEGDALTSTAEFTVSLSLDTSEVVTVEYETFDGTATVGDSDYVPTSGTLTFTPEGADTQTFTVQVIGDEREEGNEEFFVRLLNPVNAPLFNTQAVGTIINDDGAKIAVRLELIDADTGTPLPQGQPLEIDDEFLLRVFVTDVQADPTGVFQLVLDVAYNEDVVSPIEGTTQFGPEFDSLTNGTFLAGLLDDFGGSGDINPPPDPGSEQLLFEVGFKAIGNGLSEFVGSIDPTDPADELDPFLYFPAPEVPVPPGEINIANRSVNVGSNVLTVSNTSASEGGQLVFEVIRFLSSGETATVVYTTADQTAIAGQDYVATSGTLTFLPGADTQLVTVQLLDDPTDEPNETLLLELLGAVGAEIGTPGTGTIVDNDAEVSVSANNGSSDEGSELVFTVNLSAVSGKEVTVAFNTVDLDAVAGADYTSAAGTLTFAPGVTQQFVTVQTLGDIEFEADENFQLVLSNPQNATLGNSAVGTIFDVPPAGISGFVFVDVDNDGVKDSNERGLPGVIITATRESDGASEVTATREDGSYLFTGLIPGTYTVTQTQPGFYADGRDVRMGVESTTNDQYTGIVLEPSESEAGYNFGEGSVRGEFIAAFLSRRALLASSAVGGVFDPVINGESPGATLNLGTGEFWISFDGGWDGLRTIEALFDSSQGTASMKLYNNDLQEVALSTPTSSGAVLLFNGTPGETVFLRIVGNNPDVTVEISDAALSGLLVQPTGGGEEDDPPADTNSGGSSSSGSNYDPFSRFASAQPMAAPANEPLAATDASDEALAEEEEDWLLDALLA